MRELSSELSKVKIFAYLHEILKEFAPGTDDQSLGTLQLNSEFFLEIDELRRGCNEFESVKQLLST